MFSSQIYCVTFVNHRCTGGFTYFALHFIHATFCIEPRTSVVRNLEKKKFLSPFKLGNSIQYHVLVKESDYKRSFMNGVVSNYFTGSYKEMVSFFVRDRKISKKELEDLINIIEDEES